MGALGAGGVVALGGCINTGGGGGDNGGVDSEGDMADEIEIWGFSQLPPAYKSLATMYSEQADGDVSVNVKERGYDENHNQFQTAVSSGSGAPDVGTIESRFTVNYIGQDGIRNFGDEISDQTVDDMVDWTWPMLSDNQGEGRYGMPLDIAPVITCYNRNLYDKMGIAPEDVETYDDLINAAQDGLDDDEYLAAVSTNTMQWRWEMLLRQQGGEAYTENGDLQLDTEETVQAARTMRKLYDSGVVTDLEEFTESWTTAISEGRVATVTGGAWMIGAMTGTFGDMSGDWGIHRPPAVTSGGGRATNHGGSNLVIPRQISQQKANRAFDFIQWALTNEDPLMTLAEEAGIYVANTKVHDHEYWSQEMEFFGGQTQELLFDIAPEIPTMRITAEHQEVYNSMGDWMSRAATGEISPEEMASQAEEEIANATGLDTA